MQLRQLAARGLLAASVLASIVSVATVQTQTARALSQDIVISQVYGGGGNSGALWLSDFIELHNNGTQPIDVTGWSVQYASTAGSSWSKTALTGVIQPGAYYLIKQANGANTAATPLPDPNATGAIAMSATAGKVALVNQDVLISSGTLTPTGASIIDLVGFGSTTIGSETAPVATLSNTTAAIRNSNGCAETDNNAADFTVGTPAPRNSASPLSPCADSPTATPTATQTNTPEGPTTTPLPTDTPAPVCTGSITPIYAIQGSGLSAAITGTVTTRGVVIGDYELPTGITVTANYLRGFYLQDLTGDADPATSDGIFVFNANNNSVSPGQIVEVTGTASEFQSQTQISATSVVQCNASATVMPVDVQLPLSSANTLEAYEGMLVRLPQTLYVTEHFQLGRFGQVVLSVGGRQSNPTNIAAPGAPAQAVATANALSRIILDDDLQQQNPDPIIFGGGSAPLAANNTLRGGDSASGIVGVLGYTWGGNAASPNAYRVRPTQPVTFVADNPRPAAPADVGGNVRIGSFNVLNYFNTFDGRPDPAGNDLCTFGVGGAPADCRGADTAIEFDRQWPKTVAAINALNVDVLGIIEIENDGYGADSAIQDLVNKLNAASGPGTWAFINADASTGVVNALGTDAIKVGFLYKPASLTPVGKTAVLNTGAFGPILLTSGQSQQRNRPALAQSFQHAASGERFTVVVNHLKSKGSACTDQVSPIGADPDTGDGQGNCNVTRTTAAQQLVNWLATDPTAIGDPDVLIMGDLNAYAKEDPITVIRNAGYTNLIETLLGPNAYSFAFDGTWGYLDHALASASIVPQVSGVTEWHINADEPNVLDYNEDFKSAGQQVSLYAADFYRSADHDPVIVGLNLMPPATPTPLPTDTPTSTPTPLPTDTATPLPTDTATPLPTDTATPLPTNTPTPTPVPQADLAIVKGGFRIGRAVTFGIVATNRGPNAAQNVTVTDVLPENVTYISAVTTRGACSYASASRTVTCTATQLNRHQVIAISILTQRTSGGAVVNTATVSSATSDPETGNNSSTAFVR